MNLHTRVLLPTGDYGYVSGVHGPRVTVEFFPNGGTYRTVKVFDVSELEEA